MNPPDATEQFPPEQHAAWIRELRQRSHAHGNAIQSVQGELIVERMRVDDALRTQGRHDAEVDRLTAWQQRVIGAIAVIVFLFPATVGALAAVLH